MSKDVEITIKTILKFATRSKCIKFYITWLFFIKNKLCRYVPKFLTRRGKTKWSAPLSTRYRVRNHQATWNPK